MSNELIPAGTYRAQAVEAQLGLTAGGKEQVAISFQLLTPGFEGQRLAYYGTFGEKALEITIKALRVCGWQGIDLSDLSGIDANEVNLVVEHEEYPVGSGAFSVKVKWVNDGSGGLLKNVMADAERTSFAQRMRGEVARLSSGQPKPRSVAKPNGRPPEPPPHSDGDAPRGAGDMPF